MLKQLQAGLSKFFTKKWIPILVLLVLCFVLMTYSSGKAIVLDKMTDFGGAMGGPTGMGANTAAPVQSAAAPMASTKAVAASAPIAPASAPSAAASGYTAMPVANPSDLLPVDKNSQWATLNPSGTNVAIPDLLQAGYHVGLDTIGQTLKNANYQLRSDPIIEKKEIGPWLQSTIEPDYGRVPLEVGYGQR
jgi:hypothetical protein